MDSDEPTDPPYDPTDDRPLTRRVRDRRPGRARHIAFLALHPLLIAVVVACAAALVAAGVFPIIAGAGVAVKLADSKFLSPSDRALDLPNLPQRTTIYAANGTVLATVYRGQNREVFPFADYDLFARQAVLAIEDHTFYQHGGVDLSSILRAFEANLRAGRVVQGGSTITQQLVKNTTGDTKQTLQRKIVEAQDAMRLEAEYPKDRILEAYLNTIYMGNSLYGVGTAAGYYFNQSPANLDLAQAATLAGMIAAPELRNPLVAADLPDTLFHRNEVLDKMLQYGLITQIQHDEAVAEPISLSTKGRTANRQVPEQYWIDYVRHLFLNDTRFGRTEAEREYLWYQGGLKIYTTLSMNLQHVGERSLKAHYYLPSDPQASAVTINAKTGAILVMANGNVTYGTDRAKRQTIFSNAWQGLRPTGSAFKGFTLAAALEAGIQPTSQWDGTSPITIPNCGGGQTWGPIHNSEGNLPSFHSLIDATALSINVVFAQVINQIGPAAVVAIAHKMGIEHYIPAVCPITLGTVAVSPLDMTTGYQTIAGQGLHCMPFAISRIERAGQVIFRQQPDCTRVLPAGIAATETSMLERVICCGTASGTTRLPDYPARPEAGKTGTDTGFKNAYFVGYVPQVITGVWVGYMNEANRSLQGVHGLAGFGSDMAGPIWNDIMTAATAHLPIEGFPTPPAPKSGTVPNVVGMTKDAATKTLAAASYLSNPVDGPCVMKKGIVCDQTPAAGTIAPLGTAVTFTVSNGTTPTPSGTPPPTQIPVPNEVGKTKDAASADLVAKGFVVAVTYQSTGDKKQDGIVLTQAPPAGTPADPGSTVTIVVGKFKKGAAPFVPKGPGLPPWGAPLMALMVPVCALGALRWRTRRR
jgi:penicillin-binding protein 1A